jgi:ribosome-binding protein aMBF1 (putative translation factor)
MITNWEDHRKKLLADPAFRKEFDALALEDSIARSIIEARTRRGLTQKALAAKLKTKQSVISRVESARTVPSLSFLKRLAHAMNVPLRISLG